MTWVLIDVSNGGALEIRDAAKIYYWTFKSRESAMKFKRNTKRRKHGAELVGPFQVNEVVNLAGKYCVLLRD